MNSRQRRKSKRLWKSFLRKITKPLVNLYSEERHQELNDAWKSFLSNKKEIVDIAGWKLRGNAKAV